jgi:hypothetical protein
MAPRAKVGGNRPLRKTRGLALHRKPDIGLDDLNLLMKQLGRRHAILDELASKRSADLVALTIRPHRANRVHVDLQEAAVLQNRPKLPSLALRSPIVRTFLTDVEEQRGRLLRGFDTYISLQADTILSNFDLEIINALDCKQVALTELNVVKNQSS